MTGASDRTTDPALRSWIDVDRESDFPIQNLPFGSFLRDGAPRPGVAIGDAILDLRVLAGAGLLDAALPGARAVFGGPGLNALLERDRLQWRALRARLSQLLSAGERTLFDAGLNATAFVSRSASAPALPFAVADYVDFYSSLEHATNLGKILRPGGEALLPNWRHLPIGYHGRAASVVPTATPVARPRGQTRRPDASEPEYGPSRMLDFELELGFVTGDAPAAHGALSPARAREHIFGLVLLNDWSARDIQAWEYQPLGPFLSKSFATSIAPWIVTLDALEPYRVPGPVQEPPPLAYLAEDEPRGYDIELRVELESAAMRVAASAPQTISATNFRAMYWSMGQQLAHLASNGSRVRAGDLNASGTISGSDPGSYGSMIELTWRGARPLALADGSQRAFLEDGDRVTLRGWCGGKNGLPRIGFGEVEGTIAG